jgi:hypothetical protein
MATEEPENISTTADAPQSTDCDTAKNSHVEASNSANVEAVDVKDTQSIAANVEAVDVEDTQSIAAIAADQKDSGDAPNSTETGEFV